MKSTIFSVLIVMALVFFVPMAYAGLDDDTAISISLVNQDPDPAIAGNIFDMRLSVINTGGNAANNFIIEIVPEYPFELVSGEPSLQNIGTITGYQGYYDENMKIVKYRMMVDSSAPTGSYNVKVKYYEEGSYYVSEKNIPIDVKNKEVAEIIHIDKTLLVPGNQSRMKFTISNVGNAPLNDLIFSWENEDKIILPVGSDNTRYIKYIDVGGSADVEYQVIADTNAVLGLYQLNLYLTYEEYANGSSKTISTIAGVYVGGETDFDVAFSESSLGQTSFSVANIGSNPANSVFVIIPEQKGWIVSGSSSVIIGNLNKGDYTVASFGLKSLLNAVDSTSDTKFQKTEDAIAGDMSQRFAQRSAELTKTLTVQIAYTDTLGARHVIEKDVDVASMDMAPASDQVFTKRGSMNTQTGLSKYNNYFVAIAILVISAFLYKKYKRRKLMDPKYTFRQFIGRKKK
ncbi:MAG: COG1361 S-layer family protein [Candidatus Aenigmarchaeota archaeon]|nr:COG1361 S-layer family protein [Candidatus Aenigmarchaeota archaeon]MCK5333344.1 COG1361 S-layer family protein [Candidatus Aenigmarchaeota archaeon]